MSKNQNKEAAEAAEVATEEAVVVAAPFGKVINKTKNVLGFLSVKIKVKGEYSLTKADTENKRLMTKINRASELNMVDLVK
jgi:hypothetical protein